MTLRLSETQKKIVDFDDGALLVKAGPGSGKTRVLIERIKRILKSKKRCKILALTFSNMAADEMKERLEEDPEISDYLDNITVGTIHSFSLDLVQSRRNLLGFNDELVIFENNDDRKRILNEVFQNNFELKERLSKQDDADATLDRSLNYISGLKKKFISPEAFDGKDYLRLMYTEYNQYMREHNILDFDDILFYAYRILTENPGVQKMYSSLYKYIFIDEAQDLNDSQYEVIKALCGTTIKNIMLVGDAKQSIYGFNGSNSNLMTESFVKDFSPDVIGLYENFRSAKKIVEFANEIENEKSECKYVYEGELKAYCCENETVESKFIINKLIYLKKHGHSDIEKMPEFEDFAIIARNRYALTKIENELKQNNIPYYFKRTVNGLEFESEFMQIFDLAVKVYQNPKDVLHFKDLCVKVGKKYDANMSLSECLNDTSYYIIINSLDVLSGNIFDFGKVIKKLTNEIEDLGCSDDDKYLIVNDLETLNVHWKKYKSIVPSENRSLSSFRNCISLGKTQDKSADNGVALLTAHMSKGLQYEIVFVVGLCEGTFPDYRAMQSNNPKALDQEKNNMYVAVTRAKRLCYLTYPKYKQMPWGGQKFQEKSRFLSDINFEDDEMNKFLEEYEDGKDENANT